MDNCKQFNILNNDSTNLYLQNIIDSIQNIIFNINQDSNQNYISINKLNNTSNVYVSNGSNYDYVIWNNNKHKSININTNTDYNISLISDTTNYKLLL